MQITMSIETTRIIKLEKGVSRAIHSFLDEKNIQDQPLRIDLHFTGCCDTSLHLNMGRIRQDDVILKFEGLTFLINPELYELTGEIAISYVDEAGRQGYIIKSARPLGEWDGFGVSEIKI